MLPHCMYVRQSIFFHARPALVAGMLHVAEAAAAGEHCDST